MDNQSEQFMEWSKARLSEMQAAAKSLEGELRELEGDMRKEMEAAIEKIQVWISQGQDAMNEVQDQGKSAIADAQAEMQKNWKKFEAEIDRWAAMAHAEQKTFEARAKAQIDSWQKAFASYTDQVSSMQAEQGAKAEAGFKQWMANAEKTQADLNERMQEMAKAGQTSWDNMAKALDESRRAYEQAWSNAFQAPKKGGKK